MHDESFVLINGRTKAIARSKKKREFYQLVLADSDVRTAIGVADDFIDLIRTWPRKKLPYHLSEAFIAYIAVSYARPFTHTRNSKVPALPSRWSKFSDPELQHQHDRMIHLRHTLFAHSDPTNRDILIVPAGIVMFGEKVAGDVSYMLKDIAIPPGQVATLRATCVELQQRLQHRISELLDELYEGMDLPRAKFPLRFDDGL